MWWTRTRILAAGLIPNGSWLEMLIKKIIIKKKDRLSLSLFSSVPANNFGRYFFFPFMKSYKSAQGNWPKLGKVQKWMRSFFFFFFLLLHDHYWALVFPISPLHLPFQKRESRLRQPFLLRPSSGETTTTTITSVAFRFFFFSATKEIVKGSEREREWAQEKKEGGTHTNATLTWQWLRMVRLWPWSSPAGPWRKSTNVGRGGRLTRWSAASETAKWLLRGRVDREGRTRWATNE